MGNRYKGTEYSAPAPEYPAPGAEHRPSPDLEYAVPPPEYGQKTAPAEEERKRSLFLRNMLIVPLLLLIGSMLFGSGGKAASGDPTAPEPASAATETASAPATEAPTAPAPETVPEEAGAPELSGTLEAFPGGDVEAVFRLVPAPGDTHKYRLRVVRAGQEVHGGEDGLMGLSLVDDPGSLPVTGDSRTGYEVRYTGGSGAAFIPAGTQLTLYVVLIDDTDGKEYTISTNPVDPVERVYDHPVYPLGEGRIRITVCNDTLAFDIPSRVGTDSEFTILADETIPEAEFTGYDLPSARTPDGYEFFGWVVHVGNPFDPGSERDLFAEYGGDPPVEELVTADTFAFPLYGSLTKDDVERVPPAADGVRYVNVHAVWIRQDPEAICLYLDDGFGHTAEYGMDSPIYSEGWLYLCNYPTPTHEGLDFEGWYDGNGNRVDLLVSYYSFQPALYDTDGTFLGYDWQAEPNPVRLIAQWKPA